MFVGIPQLILGRKLRAMCPLHFRWARLVVCAHGKRTTETPPEQRVPGVIEEHQIGHYEAEQQQFHQPQTIDLHVAAVSMRVCVCVSSDVDSFLLRIANCSWHLLYR